MPRFTVHFLFAAVATVLPSLTAFPETADAGGSALLDRWQGQAFGISTVPPVSFLLDGTPSGELCENWVQSHAEESVGVKTRFVRKVSAPDGGLELRLEGVLYQDYPVIEWTLYLRNNGAEDTGIIENVRACDAALDLFGTESLTLHQNKGDNCVADSFQPFQNGLAPGGEIAVANTGGRPTQTAFPYFNLEGDGHGVIYVVSWAGQWSARFSRTDKGTVRIESGQEGTRFRLHPGEEVRGPMSVMMFYNGDRRHAQNLWRQWMIAHNLPRPGGNLPPLPQLAACSSHQFGEMIHADTASQIFFVDKYLERGIRLDYWWMDAGWYPCDGQWPKTGTWEIDESRFPGGFKPITGHAHDKGVRIIVWFEPERVHSGTWLTENHPEWIHGGKDGGLLKLGEPEVREWLTNHVDKLITEQGIDLYRQDFNMDPLDFWRKNDAPDRQGITEIRHVEGYFAYWDELRRRHPDMLIDSCASGGRRNDLETLRRAVPLLRSDYIMEPTGNQCHSWALADWIPFAGTGSSKTSDYEIMSTLCPHYIACWDQRDDTIDFARIKTLVDQWREYGKNYFGDYYPVTEYSLETNVWIGWQFHRPDTGGGMVQVFRREKAPDAAKAFPLSALEKGQNYRCWNVENPQAARVISGETMLSTGLEVSIETAPGAAVWQYELDN